MSPLPQDPTLAPGVGHDEAPAGAVLTLAPPSPHQLVTTVILASPPSPPDPPNKPRKAPAQSCSFLANEFQFVQVRVF